MQHLDHFSASLSPLILYPGNRFVSPSIPDHSLHLAIMLADTPFGSYLVPCLAFVLVSVLWTVRTGPTQLPDVPWLNYNKDEWFGKLRARYRTIFNFRNSIQSAYAEVGPSARWATNS